MRTFNWPPPGTARWPLTSSKASPTANASAPHGRQLDETHQPLQDDTANPRWSLGRGNTLVPCSWQMTRGLAKRPWKPMRQSGSGCPVHRLTMTTCRVMSLNSFGTGVIQERQVCLDGRRLLRAHSVKPDPLEPGGDGLVVYETGAGILVFGSGRSRSTSLHSRAGSQRPSGGPAISCPAGARSISPSSRARRPSATTARLVTFTPTSSNYGLTTVTAPGPAPP